MKVITLLTLLITLFSFSGCKSSSRNQDRVEGCRDATVAALMKKYGQPPEGFDMDSLKKEIENSCKEFLEVK